MVCKFCPIAPRVLQKGLRSCQKWLGAQGRAGGFATFTPLYFDGLVHTNSLERRLLLIENLKTTFIVQSFLGLTTPPLLICSVSSGLCCPISPSGRQSGWEWKRNWRLLLSACVRFAFSATPHSLSASLVPVSISSLVFLFSLRLKVLSQQIPSHGSERLISTFC